MGGPELSNLLAGRADAEIDVWALFQRDAHGMTGLFAGQLVNELTQSRPALLPQIVDAIRRGLASADPREHQAALQGAAQLRDEVDLTSALMTLADTTPAVARTAEFINVVAGQPVSAAARLVGRLVGVHLDGAAHTALARLLVRHRPAAVRAGLVAAMYAELSPAAIARHAPFLRALSPNDVNAFVDELRCASEEVRQRASCFLYEALEAGKDPSRHDRWRGLHTRLHLALDAAPTPAHQSPRHSSIGSA